MRISDHRIADEGSPTLIDAAEISLRGIAMTTIVRKFVLAAATVATIIGAALPASAQGWGGGGWDRDWDGPRWGHHRHHRDWERPRCWYETRRVWVETRWGREPRRTEVRVCR